jgi:hypothetical protein
MFFYFTNQITYQNNKISTMFGIVTDLVQKDIQPFDIPMSCGLNPSQNSFNFPGPSCGLVDVSDSDDDSDDDDDDDSDEDDDKENNENNENENSQPVFTLPDNTPEDNINIQLLDITDITEPEVDINSDDKKGSVVDFPEEILENDNTEELNITLVHSEAKHPVNSSAHHKSLHVNELRKMAVQLQLIQNVEAKKLKKDDLIELISKSTEGKDEAI